jgi:hypothetical protein
VATVFVGTRKQKKLCFFKKKQKGREKQKRGGGGPELELKGVECRYQFRAFIPGVSFHQVPHLGAQ